MTHQRRHCEERSDEAIQDPTGDVLRRRPQGLIGRLAGTKIAVSEAVRPVLDCFVPPLLAMTG
jgi:hypothetical protein